MPIHARPSTKSPIAVNIGPEVEFPLTVNVVAARKGWLQISGALSNRNEIYSDLGWLPTSFVSVTIKGKKGDDSQRQPTALLSTPSEPSVAKGHIASGTSVGVLDVRCGWIKVDHEGLSGWIQSASICTDPTGRCS